MPKGNVVSSSTHFDIESVCNPQRSVVVSACAGSGKTWLLVARLVRILLNGEPPQSILALTFTRKAAQEMRERLYQLLQSWTLLSDSELHQELMARGFDAAAASTHLTLARQLYNQLLSNPQTISIDTFHGWFGRLLAGAPISMGAQSGFALREDVKRLQQECLEDWWSAMPVEIRRHYEYLIDQLGSNQTHQFLLGPYSLLHQKGAWIFFKESCTDNGEGVIEPLRRCCVRSCEPNPLLQQLQRPEAQAELEFLLEAFSHGGVRDQQGLSELAAAIDLVRQQEQEQAIVQLLPVFMTRDEIPTYRKDNDTVSKTIQSYLESQGQNPDALIAIRRRWGLACVDYVEWNAEQQAIALNEAWFAVSGALMEHLHRAKERMRVRDFDDLELGVAQMIADPRVAAYWQARLDARYRHILIDEFQDTNPLQWHILRSWLCAYSGGEDRPKVFIVGDPKQSIYRFRRADPRLFGAATEFLRDYDDAKLAYQNTTRRNAPAIVEAVNRIFTSARIPSQYPFQVQETLWRAPADTPITLIGSQGEAYRLPLVPLPPEAQVQSRLSALDIPTIDHETTARQQRFFEGQRLAQLITELMATRLVLDEAQGLGDPTERQLVWRRAELSDFLILVKRRQYLVDYEQALRQANLLFESPRLGGLLETLEVDDLIALLTILSNPNHDLALAQVLRSPLYGFHETQMQTLAELVQSNRGYRNWWDALAHATDHPDADGFQRIAKQLMEWIELSKHLPVHDLLDHLYFQSDIRCRYASACQAHDRDQVLANLDAFLELALNLDGGRYPSLGRFIANLKQMRRGDEDETPDEGELRGDLSLEGEGVDGSDIASDGNPNSQRERPQRLRLMTIHGAKGLEAPFVIVLDCNHTALTPSGRGVLLDWDPLANAPKHLSMYTKGTLSKAREALLLKEQDIALHENWNLFYVALTRAKQGVWLSGVESAKNRQEDGLVPDSWYERASVGGLPLFAPSEAMPPSSPIDSTRPLDHKVFEYPDLVLTWQGQLPTSPWLEPLSLDAQKRLDEGQWFHAVLERITPTQYQPAMSVAPSADQLAQWLGIDLEAAQMTIERALTVYRSPSLAMYFDPAHYRCAWNELDVIGEGGRNFRLDRLVEFEEELVILDYKLTIPEREDPRFEQYRIQLSRYSEAVAQWFPNKRIRSLLVDAQGHCTSLSD